MIRIWRGYHYYIQVFFGEHLLIVRVGPTTVLAGDVLRPSGVGIRHGYELDARIMAQFITMTATQKPNPNDASS